MLKTISCILLFCASLVYAGDWLTIEKASCYNILATGIDDDNVVGRYDNAQNNRNGFLYNLTTQSWRTLIRPSSVCTLPTGIDGNNVIGTFLDASHKEHGFVYNHKTSTWKTFDVPGQKSLWVTGISGNKIIGYYSKDTTGNTHGYTYDINTSLFSYFDQSGCPWICAYDIFENQIVGRNAYGHGFIYDGSAWALIDPPTSSDTYLMSIDGNKLAGYFTEVINGVYREHSFVYNGNTWAVFNKPGSESTYVCGISGTTVIGYYYQVSGGTQINFVYKVPEGDLNWDGSVDLVDLALSNGILDLFDISGNWLAGKND